MTYHGVVKNVKINYKNKTIIAEIGFPAGGIISEAKRKKKGGMQSGFTLKTLIKMGFKDAIKGTNINLSWGRVKLR